MDLFWLPPGPRLKVQRSAIQDFTKRVLKASSPTCYHELTSKIIHYSPACWRDFRKYVANHNSWRAQSSHLDGLYRSKIQPLCDCLLLHPALIYALLHGLVGPYTMSYLPDIITRFVEYWYLLAWQFSCSSEFSPSCWAVYHLLIPLRPYLSSSSHQLPEVVRHLMKDFISRLERSQTTLNIAKIHGSWLKLVNKERWWFPLNSTSWFGGDATYWLRSELDPVSISIGTSQFTRRSRVQTGDLFLRAESSDLQPKKITKIQTCI